MLPLHRTLLWAVLPLLVLMGWVTPALAGQVHLTWDAPDSATPPVGYTLYAWQEPGGDSQSVDVGPQTTYTLDDLVDGATYTFAVTVYDIAGNASGESNRVTVTMPSGPTLVSPPPDTMLPGPTVLLAWTDGGASVAEWWLYVGTSVGANDLFDSGALGSERSMTVGALPTDGEVLCVRLWYVMDGTWQFSDFQYTAAPTS
jgi:hypothetical protein